jgi:protein O-GlcNAc transferase
LDQAIAGRPIGLHQTLQRAVLLHQQGQLDQAGPLYEEILAAQPDHFEILHRLGILRYQQGRKTEALHYLNAALAVNPGDVAALSNAGLINAAMGRPDEALANYDKALALKPDYVEALVNRGIALRNLQRPAEALASFDKALAFRPAYPEALNNRGNALRDLKRPGEALASYDSALASRPNYAEAFNNRGNALRDLKRSGEALTSFDGALALKADYVEAAYNKGAALMDLDRPEEALASYDRVLAFRPDDAEAHNNRGAALAELRRSEEALASCDKALALKPDHAEAHNNRGNALRDLDRFDDALASYDRAIQCKRDYAEAYANSGDISDQLKRYDEALLSYQRAVQLKPDTDFLAGKLLHTRMKVCDWRAYGEDVARLPEQISRLERIVHPFAVLALSGDPGLLRKSSEIWTKAKYASGEAYPAVSAPRRHPKIRIGYFSSDFHQHATAILMAGLFEAHDRAQFDVTAFSFGPETNDRMRQRLKASFDRFIDVRANSDREIASLARELEIDIAVDLKGFTQDARSRIFAMRPAPVQVNYLGYPGTMGSDCIDYLIADATVIPPAQRRHYSEKIVYLPNAYQPNDRKREIAGGKFTRAEAGLSQEGFVFCCFNNNFKIAPAQFDIWMRILKSVDGSVLWLFQDNARAASNLRAQAARRGVDPARIVFAPRAPAPEHLARHRLADLFLDTLPFNAHTTASDALWAGLPVLAQMGDAFAGRVAASLLQAIGLPELIAASPEAYETLAIELARYPARLETIKHKLERNRLATPLFDTERFTRHIEAAYAAMHQRHLAGLPPDHIHVPN